MQTDTEEFKLYQAVRSDNLPLFGEIIDRQKGLLSICYGRFPLLSICYLYRSNKIIKKYEQQLASVKNYNRVDEEYDIYRLFKRYAARSLKFYVFEESKVTPPEMLAVMGEMRYLQIIYPKYYANDNSYNKINDIIKLGGYGEIVNTEYGVVFPKQPLSKRQKKIFNLAVAILAVLVIFFSVTVGAIFGVYGSGTANNPFIINSSEQFLTAAKDSGDNYYKLKDDISITPNAAVDFGGTLEGGGHTVNINGGQTVFNEIKGKIYDINFVYEDLDLTIDMESGLLSNKVSGTLANIDISASGQINESGDEEKVLYGIITGVNSGTITDCTVFTEIYFTGDGNGDASIAAVAGDNSGEINNCIISENSVLTADTADIAAVAVINQTNGKINNCTNNAKVEQSSDNEGWNPNTSGIAVSNLGTVKGCVNNGNIVSATTADNVALNVFGGGIVCTNEGTVEKCKNNGKITVRSEHLIIYAGGIAAYGVTRISYLLNNGNNAMIKAVIKNRSSVFAFAGGIVGYTAGVVKNCFSNAEFSSSDTYGDKNNMAFFGGIIGLFGTSGIGAEIDGNYYVEQDNVNFGIASVIYQNVIYYGNDDGCPGVRDFDELKKKEVYWE